MRLVIDSGNSFTKAGFFEQDKLIRTLKIKNEEFNSESISYEGSEILISTVSDVDFSFLSKASNALFLKSTTPLPIKLEYSTPETLGTDRIAVASGASILYPNTNCLIINAGTCITYDLIDENMNYQGGSISPGLQMRYKALNHFTAKLPLLNQKATAELIGKSTTEAIASGVLNGITAEVEGIILRYRQIYPQLNIILTGGDADFFETTLKGHIFVNPDLVLIGLNRILEHNA